MSEIAQHKIHHVLVTGANGFVGRALCKELTKNGFKVRAAIRQPVEESIWEAAEEDKVMVGEIGPETDWTAALQGVDAVVHLAARVHVMQDFASNPLAEFRKTNVAGTLRLARACVTFGIKRFIYLSSIKVNGEKTEERSFTERDRPNPKDPYAISKWEAEQALQKIAHERGIGLVVLRPPLIYGPNVRANFLQLMRLVDRGIPLPFSMIRNRRSFLYLNNLASAIRSCLTHSDAMFKTYLVSDGTDISTPELVHILAKAMGRPGRIIPCPVAILKGMGKLAGRSAPVGRLVESLRMDSSRIRRELSWIPPYSIEEGLRATATWYVNNKTRV